jgi:HEAT repeat protein
MNCEYRPRPSAGSGRRADRGGTLGESILIASVLALFGWAVAMALFTVWLRIWSRRRRRAWQAAEDEWRPLVKAFVLEGAQLSSPSGLERRVTLDLLLRYASLLRGAESERIVAFLEREGYVADTLLELRARNRWKRAQAAGLLGRMRSQRAVGPLIRALRDESPDVRTMAAHSLAAIGDRRAIAALAAALADSSRWAASTVATDLIEMGAEVVPTLVEIALRAEGRGADAHEAAVTAVRVLGEIRDPRATPALLGLLEQSADLDLRARAAAALGTIGGPQAARALAEALQDPAWQVRAQAATGLGALGDVLVVPSLKRAIYDESWWVRRNCAEALGRLGATGQLALEELSESSDRYVRDRALAVLEALANVAPSVDERVVAVLS